MHTEGNQDNCMPFALKGNGSLLCFCNALFDYDNNTYLNFITDEYQIKIGMIPHNYVHETNVF